jgi:hypothetical protein
MIERFNFFDVYAYLLPGLAFLGLMWLPFGIVGGSWPSADLSSALLSLVAAYIVGHALYFPSSEALSTEDVGQYRAGVPLWRAIPTHPSNFILDAGERTFPERFKMGLGNLINSWFRGDAEVDVAFSWDNADQSEVQRMADESARRDLAFLLCRSVLVTANAASYAQQFEGLYQFLRCLTAVFALGFANHVGWALALRTPISRCVSLVAAVAVLAIIAVAAIVDKWGYRNYRQRAMKARMTIGLLMLALFLCPFFLRSSIDLPEGTDLYKVLLLGGIAFVDLFIALRCSSGYKPFAKKFAEQIYRDFYVYAKSQNKADSKAPALLRSTSSAWARRS